MSHTCSSFGVLDHLYSPTIFILSSPYEFICSDLSSRRFWPDIVPPCGAPCDWLAPCCCCGFVCYKIRIERNQENVNGHNNYSHSVHAYVESLLGLVVSFNVGLTSVIQTFEESFLGQQCHVLIQLPSEKTRIQFKFGRSPHLHFHSCNQLQSSCDLTLQSPNSIRFVQSTSVPSVGWRYSGDSGSASTWSSAVPWARPFVRRHQVADFSA